jgi:hypothetical protein
MRKDQRERERERNHKSYRIEKRKIGT